MFRSGGDYERGIQIALGSPRNGLPSAMQRPSAFGVNRLSSAGFVLDSLESHHFSRGSPKRAESPSSAPLIYDLDFIYENESYLFFFFRENVNYSPESW